ncbi:unnamed protein product [Rotaria socialis]|uniref:Uncharacterized protein n=1 Tax=Rotaria socialis TaxID=392032 RepID=A0A817W295_9BILA|nr:unnamed protein product [Rotaria socialis]CAF4329739.1 unnamed protein product [Rotaria socialis]CAF4510697.1 unnamed protein product [Rotaria socialis]CAF4927663.1 unnamed protein product [Rotaria socialis]
MPATKTHGVKQYRVGYNGGRVVAGANGKGNRLDQLDHPHCVFVDHDHSVYMSDKNKHRVMAWEDDAKQVVVDRLCTVYVADAKNLRIMRCPKESTQRNIIAGGNGDRGQSKQLYVP